jgi:hypothetical protein
VTNPDVTPQDALEIAQRAMQKASSAEQENQQLRDEIDDLRDDLVEVRVRLSEMDDDKDYQSLTLEDKVGKVREHGYRKARNRNGRAMLDYSDVMWEVFDGSPGNNHCYKLIKLAAGLEDEKTGSECPGFTARDPDNGSYHLAINADRVKQNAEFYSRNKADQAGAD